MKFVKICLAIATIAAAVGLNSDSHEETEETEAVKTVSLELKITNIEESEGTVIMGIFADEQAWKDLEPDHRLEAKPSTEGASATIDLEPGEYAASAYHDVNGDDKFNRKTGLLRGPDEPFGFSNNARPRFGVPQWKRVKFTVDEDTTEHTIKLIQP